MRSIGAIIVAVAVVASGCSGNVAVPETRVAALQDADARILRRIDTVLQQQAQLDGRMQTLIQLKQQEVAALRDITDGLKLNQTLFERLLDVGLGGGASRQ